MSYNGLVLRLLARILWKLCHNDRQEFALDTSLMKRAEHLAESLDRGLHGY